MRTYGWEDRMNQKEIMSMNTGRTISPKALIIVTSHTDLGSTGRKTGFYFDEMATPYWRLADAGYDVEIASIKGGPAPIDPNSYGEEGNRPAAVQRFMDDRACMSKLAATKPAAEIGPRGYRTVFLPGGHGTMWDFTNVRLAELIGAAWDNGAVVGAVCHGPAGLVQVKQAGGSPLVEGRKVNSFTDEEETAVQLAQEVPFLLESELRRRGAKFESSPKFQAHAVRDGRLVTGQNPQSVERVAELLIQALAEQPARTV
jgi:putative intracellular protease/amidase